MQNEVFPQEVIEGWLQDLESDVFDARLHLASGLVVAEKILRGTDAIEGLVRACRAESRCCDRLLRRVESLVERPIDPSFSSPWDSALCAHLFVLHEAAPLLAHSVAARILSAPNLWWAGQLATSILRSQEARTSKHLRVVEGGALRTSSHSSSELQSPSVAFQRAVS